MTRLRYFAPRHFRLHAQASQKDAVVAAVKGEQLVTEAVAVKELDLATMTAADADFTADFTLRPLVPPPPSRPCISVIVV